MFSKGVDPSASKQPVQRFENSKNSIDGNELSQSEKTAKRSSNVFSKIAEGFSKAWHFLFPTTEQKEAKALAKAEKQFDNSAKSLVTALSGNLKPDKAAFAIASIFDALEKIGKGQEPSNDVISQKLDKFLSSLTEDQFNRLQSNAKNFDSMSSRIQTAAEQILKESDNTQTNHNSGWDGRKIDVQDVSQKTQSKINTANEQIGMVMNILKSLV